MRCIINTNDYEIFLYFYMLVIFAASKIMLYFRAFYLFWIIEVNSEVEYVVKCRWKRQINRCWGSFLQLIVRWLRWTILSTEIMKIYAS